MADLVRPDQALPHLQTLLGGQQVLDDHAEVRAYRRQAEEASDRLRGGDHGVRSRLAQQGRVVVFAHRYHHVRARVQLADGQGDQDRRVVAVQGDDHLTCLDDLRAAQYVAPGGVAVDGGVALEVGLV